MYFYILILCLNTRTSRINTNLFFDFIDFQADAVLDVEYAAEMRMVIHFQLLTIVSAKSRVEKESVEFQMFLRENRFKLMANGVTPPASIFRSNSYANIDMKLVANWLIRLTNEQHERFNQLYVKSVFIVHVGGTRCVTSSTDNNMKIHVRITLNVKIYTDMYFFMFR